MHQVLQIDEILVRILAELQQSRDVASMARVCRAFNPSASDILWRKIPSIDPLIMCMPPDLMNWSHLPTHDLGFIPRYGSRFLQVSRVRLSFKRDLIPDDWKRFHHYAARVLFFERDQNDRRTRFEPDQTVSIAFGLHHQPCPNLFPRLQSLEVPLQIDEREFQFLHLMIGPQLKSFTMSTLKPGEGMKVSDGSIAHLLKRLEGCYSLTDLEIASYRNDSIVNDIVTQFPFLRNLKLHLNALSQATLVSLAKLPELKTLSFRLDFLIHSDSIGQQSHFFPSLQDLCVVTPNLDMSTSLIETLNLRQWTSIGTILVNPTTLESIQHHISTLKNLRFPSALEQLEIRVWNYPEFHTITSSTPTVDSRTLCPLFVFRCLRSVLIELPSHIDIDDEFINDVASSWPLLYYLQLRGSNQMQCKVTLEGLVPLAHKCRYLYGLELGLAGIIPSLRQTGDGACNYSLMKLVVYESEVDDEEEDEVADFLSSIFPRVQIVCDKVSPWRESWHRISKLVPIYARARHREANGLNKVMASQALETAV